MPLTAIRCGEYDKRLIYRELSSADKSMGFGRRIVNLKYAHSVKLPEQGITQYSATIICAYGVVNSDCLLYCVKRYTIHIILLSANLHKIDNSFAKGTPHPFAVVSARSAVCPLACPCNIATNGTAEYPHDTSVCAVVAHGITRFRKCQLLFQASTPPTKPLLALSAPQTLCRFSR